MSLASDREEIVSTPGGTGSDGIEIVSTTGGMSSATINSALSHSDVDDIYESAPFPRRIIPSSIGDSNPWSNVVMGSTGSTIPTNVTTPATSSAKKKRRTKISDAQQDAKVNQVMAAIEENRKLSSKKDGRLTRDQILASFDMSGSQLTRWQQRCVICLSLYSSQKHAFSCTTPECDKMICKSCMAYDVTRNLLLKEVYVHKSSFPCSFCRVVGSMDLTLVRPADASRREGLRDAIMVHVQEDLKVNDESIVPLMSALCIFRSKMKANYEAGPRLPFNTEEVETVLEFLSLWGKYSGLNVDSNRFKTTQRGIDFSIQWLRDSLEFVLEDEIKHWVSLNHQFEGWFATMIDFALKCHERMMGLAPAVDIKQYPFCEELLTIAVTVATIFVE